MDPILNTAWFAERDWKRHDRSRPAPVLVQYEERGRPRAAPARASSTLRARPAAAEPVHDKSPELESLRFDPGRRVLHFKLCIGWQALSGPKLPEESSRLAGEASLSPHIIVLTGKRVLPQALEFQDEFFGLFIGKAARLERALLCLLF